MSSSASSRRLRTKLNLTFERRRAERFAELVDESSGHRRRHRRTEYDAELMPLATLATSLATTRLSGSPGKEYGLGLRAMLMATIEREGIGASAVNPEERPAERPWQSPTRQLPVATARASRSTAGTRRRTRVAVLAGVTTGALVLSGVSMAGTNALPGQPLYPVKLQAEKAQLAMAGNDLSRGYLHLGFARARLDESYRLVDQPDRAAETLTSMREELQAGVKMLLETLVFNVSGGANITATIDQARTDLDKGLGRLPNKATDEWQANKDLLDQIGMRLEEVKGWLLGKCKPTSGADDLGPTFTCQNASSTKSGN